MPTFNTDGLAGCNILQVDATPIHREGTVASLSDGGTAVYCKALSEISTYAYALLYADGTAQMATTTLAGNCKRGGWAQTSIPSAYYGWLQISGTPKGNLASACDDNVPLYTTATSGVLDDATVSGVGGMVAFATSTVTISNATAVTLIVGRGQGILTGVQGT